MYVLSGWKNQIVNSDFVERFCISVKDDAALVIASYGVSIQPVTMAKYKDEKEAKVALNELYAALVGGQTGFDMPESLYGSEGHMRRDARVKRRGGS